MDIEDIKLREIQMFLNLVRLKSVRELGRQFNLQPGQVSKWIQNLERKVGFPLVERSANGIQPTARALDILPYFEKIHDLQENLTGFTGAEAMSPSYTFASSSFFSTHLIPPLLKEFLEQSSYQAKVRIIDLPPTQFIPAALRGAYEYCLHSQKLDWPRTWTTNEVGSLSWQIYARSSHPVHKNPQLKEVLKYPFIIPIYWAAEGTRFGDDQCPIPMKQRKRGHETATAASAVELLKVCDELAFVPDIVARKGVEEGELQVVKIPSWKPMKKPVFLSVKSAAVKQKDYDLLNTVCAKILRNL